ncbi:MAG: acyltransferase [Muribaculaceae bacterium]|nr:acyltransferase [Muribaculaceae bacterium]
MAEQDLPPRLIDVNTPRIAYLDTIRVIACLMVVLVHCPHPHETVTAQTGLFYGAVSYLCSPCIGLFLMVSGALLFPLKTSGRIFLKRRLGRIVWPLVVWSAVALVVGCLMGTLTWSAAVGNFLRLPLGCVRGFEHGWYLYVLVGIYLFVPVIGVWVSAASRRQLQYFIILWTVVMSFPYVIAAFGEFGMRILEPFSGFMGYMVLGYYLHRYPVRLHTVWQWGMAAALFVAVAVVLPAIVYLSEIPGYDKFTQIIYNYRSVSTEAMCVAIFVLVHNFNPGWRVWNRMVRGLAVVSFGIYLCNFIVIRQFFMPYFVAHPMSSVYLEVFVTFAGSLAVSWIIVRLLGLLPFRKYIIG